MAAPRNGATPGYRRIVAKFGTNLLTAGTDRLDLARHGVARQARSCG